MAATGKTPILLYGSTTPTNAPVADNLTNSSDGCEIAINVADKNLFFKDSSNNVNTVPIRQSSASSNGWLSSTDWSTFNGKQPAGTYVTSVTGTAPVVSSGGTTPAISMAAATGSVNGYLTSTDWTTFNNKSPAAGSSSITTVGTITSGTWNGTAIANANLANSSITFGSTAQTLGSTVSNINGVVIGNSSAAAGTFTDITATGSATFGGATATSITSYSGSNWNFSQLNLIRKAANTATPRLLSFMLDGDSSTSTTIGDYPAIWGIYNAAPTTSSTSSALQAQMGFASYYGFKWYVNGTNVVNVLSSGSLCVGNTTDAGAGNLCVGSQSGSTATPGNILMDGSYTSTPAWNSLKFYLYKGASESYGITVGSLADVQYWAGSSTSGIHRWYTKQTEQMRIHASGGVSIGNTTDPGATNLSVTGKIWVGTTSNVSGNATITSQAAASQSALVLGYSNATRMADFNNNGNLYLDIVNGNTTASAANVYIDPTYAVMQRSTSSIKYKKNVQDATFGLDDVMKLRPVTYQGVGKFDSELTFGGLIAEEVDEAGLDVFVQYAEDGSPDSLAYGNMVALAFAAIKEQQAMIVELQNKITILENK